MRAPRRLVVTAAAMVALGLVTTGCSSAQAPVPACTSFDRLALVAQSVPTAAYVPCLASLPPGWRASGFLASNRGTRFTLASDRAPGRPVHVDLAPTCDITGATATTPRGPGVRTYTNLRSITPSYAGTLTDVFAGGCVTYHFDFPRGPHIGLMEDFESAITLYPRQQLALKLHRRLGVTIG